MPKHDGGRPSETSRDTRPVSTLSDLGVTRDQSSEWQKLAAVPEDDFQAAIDEAAEQGVVSRAKVMAVHYSVGELWRARYLGRNRLATGTGKPSRRTNSGRRSGERVERVERLDVGSGACL